MDPIEALMTEHRLIERTLDALEVLAASLARGEPADRAEVARFARFFAEFADAHHHGKEEDLLFAAMVEAGFPRESGPIAVMLHEHGVGRQAVGVLRRVGAGEGELAAAERSDVVEAATTYAAMLRAHIRKEDRILYPMAESHLPEEAFANLRAAFARFEAERGGGLEGLLALAEELHAAHRAGGADAEPASFKLNTKVGHGHGDGHGGCCGCGH